MADINTDNLPFNYIYLTDERTGALLSNDDETALLIAGTRNFPTPPVYNGSGGNRLLCTSYIVDMGIPRLPQGVGLHEPNGPSRDSRGRAVHWGN